MNQKYILTANRGGYANHFSFSSEEDAHEAARLLGTYEESPVRVTIKKDISSLDGWRPDAGDLMAFRAFGGMTGGLYGNGGKVEAIKFARVKAGCGLKEAKDWIDANFETLKAG